MPNWSEILRDRYMEDPSDINVAQIENLRKRLNLTRMMQVFGIASLFFCVVTMFLIYIGLFLLSIYIFGLALLLLIASLGGFPPRDTDIHPCPGHLPEYDGRQAEALTAHVQDSYHPYTEKFRPLPIGIGRNFYKQNKQGEVSVTDASTL